MDFMDFLKFKLSWPWPKIVIGEGDRLDWWNLSSWLGSRFPAESVYPAIVFFVCALACIVIPYLLGSINPAIVISKTVYRDDIRNHGSGNAGTTNMLRTYGAKAAVITVTVDCSKAIVAMILGHFLLGANGEAIAGLFVGIGHIFPLYYRFRGGKGVACFAMVMLMIHPVASFLWLVIFLTVAIGTRYVSLAALATAFLYPFLIKWFSPVAEGSLLIAMGALASVLMFAKHWENMQRMWNNQESKLDLSKFKRKEKKLDVDGTEENQDA